MSVRFAQVIHYYPNYGTAELAMMDTGQRFQNCTVLCHFISSNSGNRQHHAVLRPPSEEEAGGMMFDDSMRTVMAACIMTGGQPMVIGFLAHPMTQLSFIAEESNRDIYRHPAGTLHTVSKSGNFEFQHTGAMYVRVANEVGGQDRIQHEDLTPLCANLNWELPVNDPPTITVSNNLFRLVVEPNGDTEMLSGGNLTFVYRGYGHITIEGDARIWVEGNTTLTSGGDVQARTLGSATVTAQGDAHVLAQGSGNVVSQGTLLLGSAEKVIIEAPVVEVAAGEVDITASTVGISATTGFSGDVGIDGSLGVTQGVAITGDLGVVGIVGITGVLGVGGIITAPEIIEGIGAGWGGGFGGGGGATTGGVGAELGIAGEQVGAANADVAQAAADVSQAVTTCEETSEPARGTGIADNEGADGTPAPDVP